MDDYIKKNLLLFIGLAVLFARKGKNSFFLPKHTYMYWKLRFFKARCITLQAAYHCT